MKLVSQSFLSIALLGSGCAHSVMRGSVAMKVNEKESYVCLGNNEVEVGDKVQFFKNQCNSVVTRKGAELDEPICEKILIGEGRITEILNEHYSRAISSVDPSIPLNFFQN